MSSDPPVIGKTAETPQQLVQRWYETEGSNDSPCIPRDWPDEFWSILVSMYPDMQFWVSHQSYAPEAVIRSLASADDWRVRHRVAMKRNLPKDLFTVLAADPEPLVRMSVARNAKTPLAVLTQLADDPSGDVVRVASYSLEKRL